MCDKIFLWGERKCKRKQLKTIKEVDLTKVDVSQYSRAFVGCLILAFDGQLILQYRPKDFYTHPDCYSLFGGRIEIAETPIQALQRELREELEAEVNKEEVIFCGAVTEGFTDHSELIYHFFWHDKQNTIGNCHEGEMKQFSSALDIFVGVTSIQKAKEDYIALIKSLGYEYWDENPNKERMFFVKGMPPYGDKRTHHVHIVEKNSEYWNRVIRFRDCLREKAEYVSLYNQLKLDLQKHYPYDREGYTKGKGEFVQEVLRKAG
jgi:8-oxo-dGTP pyrophosphatase MutT (NUDIX family)